MVIVNTAKGVVGEDTAALLGATLLNLVSLGIAEQASLDPHRRRPVTIVVDEFHTIPGADYDAILSELAKYGANLVLATQSLTRLESLDRERSRSLRATVFANLDGLFAFHMSAEDARYLVPELGGYVDEQDLVALGEHQCYVKVSAGSEPLPPFWVRLDRPPESDSALADRIAAVSARRYGRDRAAVERDLQLTLARVQEHKKLRDESQGDQGQAKDAEQGNNKSDLTAGPTRARNEYRNRVRRTDVQPRQIPLPDGSSPADKGSSVGEREQPELGEGMA